MLDLLVFFLHAAKIVHLDGAIAKRLCLGLQIRLVRFDSGSRLQDDAPVVKSVDTRDLKSLAFTGVPVRFWPGAPLFTIISSLNQLKKPQNLYSILYLIQNIKIHHFPKLNI